MNKSNPHAKKPINPNPFREVFFQQRKALIENVVELRKQRESLKGVKGSSQQWAKLSEQIDQTQAKINTLSDQLGLVRTHIKTDPTTHSVLTKDVRTDGFKRDELHVIGAETSADKSLMILNDEDLDAWDRLDQSVNGNK